MQETAQNNRLGRVRVEPGLLLCGRCPRRKHPHRWAALSAPASSRPRWPPHQGCAGTSAPGPRSNRQQRWPSAGGPPAQHHSHIKAQDAVLNFWMDPNTWAWPQVLKDVVPWGTWPMAAPSNSSNSAVTIQGCCTKITECSNNYCIVCSE